MKEKADTLFDYAMAEQLRSEAPLADRMRPRTLDEFVGQEHILAKGRLLRRAIQADQLSSLIFYGPPGTGKTTLAQIIAGTTKAEFLMLNAVLSGVKDIRESIEKARIFRQEQQRKTILFIDEVHRFNKAQQDALLPHVEKGTIILIGATTENPYFEVNKALVSRSRIFQLKSLVAADLREILEHALADRERGYGRLRIEMEEDAKEHLANVANGDARALLNALELAVITSEEREGVLRIDLSTAEESIQQRALLYDKDGDAHFDHISAFIKSVRGSDPDAALYWMAKMIYAGEDPKFLFRRMIILACEDVGLADPRALEQVVACARAFDYVGMPEGRFHLAQACLYLATAKKSNSNFAFFDALRSVSEEREKEVPDHLKDASRDKKGFGHGEGYLYPHAYQDHWVSQQYLPKALQGRLFYQPGELGFEKELKEGVLSRREAQLAAMLAESEQGREESWQERSLGSQGELLASLREKLLAALELGPDQLILNVNAQSGLFLGPILRGAINPSLHALVFEEREKEIIQGQYAKSDQWTAPQVWLGDRKAPFEGLIREGLRFDRIFGRNLIFKDPNRKQRLAELFALLSGEGRVFLLESMPQRGQRLGELLLETGLFASFEKELFAVDEEIFQDRDNPMLDWTLEELNHWCEELGLKLVKEDLSHQRARIRLSREMIAGWSSLQTTERPSYAQRMQGRLDEAELQGFLSRLKGLEGRMVDWKSAWLLLGLAKG